MIWPSKDLLDVASLSREQAEEFFQYADACEKTDVSSLGKGKTVVLLFFEKSTRTRISFEVAAGKVGAGVSVAYAEAISVGKGETLEDTFRVIQSMGVDAVVVRHPISGVLERPASKTTLSVINAGDGMHEHPTQALLDAWTIRKRFGKLDGLRVTVVGDILHSRVARSNFHLLSKFGVQLTAVGPATLLPAGLSHFGVQTTTDLDKALIQADVVYVLRIQHERQQKSLIPSVGDYAKGYLITADRLAKAKSTCVVMHPGPMNRGVEITDQVADGPRSLIFDQVKNGVAIRTAVLAALFNRRPAMTTRREVIAL